MRRIGYRRAGIGCLDEFRETHASANLSEFVPAEALRTEFLNADRG